MKKFKFFEIEIQEDIAIIWLNNPKKRNFMNSDFWFELPEVIHEINDDNEIKAMVIAGKGASFTMGLDLKAFLNENPALADHSSSEARHNLYKLILKMQAGMNAIEDSPKPSIAAIHRHCIGGGLDLISACDIRYATKDAMISLREVKVHIVADMGSLQRLPNIIGEAKTKELALTGKDISGEEAKNIKLVNEVFDSKEEMYESAIKLAKEIASNSSFVTAGVKHIIHQNRKLSTSDSLEYVAMYNSSFIHSQEFIKLMSGFIKRIN